MSIVLAFFKPDLLNPDIEDKSWERSGELVLLGVGETVVIRGAGGCGGGGGGGGADGADVNLGCGELGLS